jgi:hypothetical protein
MAGKISIQNSKYFRLFDNTDNPCCWQVESISNDVDDILDGLQIDYEVIPGDWGTSYSWWSKDGIEHCLNIACIDTNTAKFEIEFWATKKVWLGLRRTAVEFTPDFDMLLPKLNQLNQEAQQDATSNGG